MFFAGTVLSGCAWWLIAHFVGGDLFEDYKGLEGVGAVLTGIMVGYASKPVYKKRGWPHLLWLTPASIYLAIVPFAIISFLLKFAVIGPAVIGQSGTNPGMTLLYERPFDFFGLIVTMWWGVTFTLYPAILVPASFLNHLLMRRLAKSASTTPAAT